MARSYLMLVQRLATLLGTLLIVGASSLHAADPVYVWEVVSTYRTYLDDGRIGLMSDGKTDTGIDWTIKGGKADFGRLGEAKPLANGTFFKGNWIGGWQLSARVLMSNTSLKSEPSKAFTLPAEAGQSVVGTRFSTDLSESIVDLWEFVAIKQGTNQFIRLTCTLTPNNLVLDRDQKIGSYELGKNSMTVKFLDPKFEEIEFKLQRNGSLLARIKSEDRKYWDLSFVRVQRLAAFQSADRDELVIYTNNRVNSPQYTNDFWTTWNWYFDVDDGKRRLMMRNSDVKLSANGRSFNWGGEKMILVAGQPFR